MRLSLAHGLDSKDLTIGEVASWSMRRSRGESTCLSLWYHVMESRVYVMNWSLSLTAEIQLMSAVAKL